MKALVTICDASYSVLLTHWLGKIRKLTDLPVFVLALGNIDSDPSLDCNIIQVDPTGNPFPTNLPDHACAEKLRLFRHLPSSASEILFLDIDLMVLHDFWNDAPYFEMSEQKFVATQDLFVGYKEKMEDEFRPFDAPFRMKFFPDGGWYYFNTGVFFASRDAHAEMFDGFLAVWKQYVEMLGKYPSIFDQNVINYCLIRFGVEAEPLPVQNNCLRQYPKILENGEFFLYGLRVNALHFNGGTIELKLARWLEAEKEMEG